MARPVNQVRWDQWRQVIARQRASGLSVAEFCRKENVSRQGFHVWNRKLRQTASAPRGSAGAGLKQRSSKRRRSVAPRRRSRRVLTGPAVPTATPGFLQLPVSTTRPTAWIELALPDGTLVRLLQENLAALVTVLRALRGEHLDLSEGAGYHA
jgi:transposase-like protein